MFTKPASDDKWTWRGLVGRFEKSSLIWIWKECQLRLREMYTVLSFLVVDQLLSHVRLSATLWTVAHQASLSFTILQSLLKLMFIVLVMPCKHLVLCHPLLLPPSIFPSISSVQFSHSVVSDSLQPHELQHIRPPCPSPTPGVHPNPCPSSQWCHPTILSSVVPFSSCHQSFPASGSLQMSQLSASGGQSIGVSASTSVPLMNTQDWFPLGWTGWISLQSKGLSRVFSNTTLQKHQFFGSQLSSQSNSHIHTWLLEKP